MLIRNLHKTPREPVDASGARRCSMAVMVGREDGAPNFAVRHIVVAPSGATPHHSHDYEHEVVVLEGEGTVSFDGHDHPITAGDVVYVPAGHEHQFRAGEAGELRFLCVTPTSSMCGEPVPGT